jgi:hypothetical protein
MRERFYGRKALAVDRNAVTLRPTNRQRTPYTGRDSDARPSENDKGGACPVPGGAALAVYGRSGRARASMAWHRPLGPVDREGTGASGTKTRRGADHP